RLHDVLTMRVRTDQTGVDGKTLAADQSLRNATAHRRLEQFAPEVAIAEPAVAVLREGRMIRHIAFQPEPAEPAICEIEVDLLAQPPFRADAEAIAHQQHPDHQFGIDRGTAQFAVEWLPMRA